MTGAGRIIRAGPSILRFWRTYRQTTFPFGTKISAETTGNSNQVFTSYDRSTTSGLDYAVNRTYSKGQGRFTQVDPIGMASASLGNPQSNNLYAYVQNMPTDFVDPSGLFTAGPYSPMGIAYYVDGILNERWGQTCNLAIFFCRQRQKACANLVMLYMF